jgi:mono/diheme cytochrome c family protein
MDVPAWWLLGRKTTMYSDGRTDARAVRPNMQFLLGELSIDEFKELEPAFRDIQAYLKSLKPPKYPFPIDSERAERGQSIFKKTCARCHGTYGPDGVYPNKIVPLDIVKTDPARALGMSQTLLRHYNSTWFAENYPAREGGEDGYQAPPLDGVWATAPYLHNGSVPTVDALLDSKTRPARFLRPPTTAFKHYDPERLGWKAPPIDPSVDPKSPEARFQVDTARFGLGNGGHTFGDKMTEDERRDVIEYLKTL